MKKIDRLIDDIVFRESDAVDRLISEILYREGGYVNHGADRGGPTNRGITLKTYRKWKGYKCSIDLLKSMSEKEAREIYFKKYYKKPRIDFLPKELQGQVLDCSINHGPSRAIKLLQKALNLTSKSELSVDGRLGKLTINQCKYFKDNHYMLLTNSLVACRIQFYRKIVEKDSTQKVFLKGWLNRAKEFMMLLC